MTISGSVRAAQTDLLDIDLQRIARQDRRTFEHMRQLPHIARPVMVVQSFLRLRSDGTATGNTASR